MPDFSRYRKWLFGAVQFLVSAGLLAWIFQKPEFRTGILHTLLSARPSWLAAGLVLSVACSLLGVLRWRVFLAMLGLRVGFWESLRILLVGQFFDTFVLGTLGGDAVRIAMLVGKGYGKSVSAFSVILDRISGTVGLIVLAPLLIRANHTWLARCPAVSMLTGTIFIYLLVILVLLTVSLALSSIKFATFLPERFSWRSKIIEMEAQYFQFVARWPQSLRAVLLSILLVTVHFSVYFCCVRACGINVSWFHFLAMMPVVDIITGLPVSLGGAGVREQLFITLLGGLCLAPPALAVSASLAGFLLSSVWGAAGFAAWSVDKASRTFEAAGARDRAV